MPSAYIVDAVRTPIGRHKGALASVRPDDLAALTLRALVERNHLDVAPLEAIDGTPIIDIKPVWKSADH
jgi:acetyl-CoA acyltransferase